MSNKGDSGNVQKSINKTKEIMVVANSIPPMAAVRKTHEKANQPEVTIFKSYAMDSAPVMKAVRKPNDQPQNNSKTASSEEK